MKKIKELRKRHGHTLKDLAEKVNYDPSNLSKIERGINQPSLTLLTRIAEVYSKDLDYFVEEDKKWYSDSEKTLIHEMDLASPTIIENFNFYIDGQKITKEELEFMVELTRNLRNIVKKSEK
ncbi:XRE family transcriptional regulator [Bacillus sp. FJAT-42376]|uniref:helix-turn-helix domain-containing protein n=1 Tax=Bacillus sp. FJAT-42376 TaxID=2014076 RepID=UPI000F4EC0E8|nr:helix-turn-helix transcriptional regulator [Bacillus sp. FJAT-42376]AZB42442.1 XRE family transcriptional regulator [Bacillus sp. FJAT-42376]